MIASDAPGVYDVIRQVEAADEMHHRMSASDVADMVEGRTKDFWIDALVGIDSDNHICAVAAVRVLASLSDHAAAEVNAYIHPHWRGRGLGRALLYWQDGRARQMLVETFGADSKVPASIFNFVDAHMTDRRRLYIAAGFYAKATFQVMYRELLGSEKARKPRHGYSIIPWSDVDMGSAKALYLRSFTEHTLPYLHEAWWDESTSHLDPRWSFGAVSEQGELAGCFVVGRPVERWAATGKTEAYAELLAVDHSHRGHGLSTALIGAAVAAAAESGMSRIGLDVDTKNASNAHSIYEHLGFLDGPAQVFYTIDQ